MKSLTRRIQRLEATLLPAAETDFDRMLRARIEGVGVLLERSAKVRPLPFDRRKRLPLPLILGGGPSRPRRLSLRRLCNAGGIAWLQRLHCYVAQTAGETVPDEGNPKGALR
jgi:hypothetical protein